MGGMEFACAIPGTTGGGVRMNAGAYERDWSDIVERALVVSADEAAWLSRDELDLQYRHSVVGAGQVVAQVEFRLHQRDPGGDRRHVAELNARRKATQPINRRTFGSVFKNPDHALGAGAGFDACGLKGHTGWRRTHLAETREFHRERRATQPPRMRSGSWQKLGGEPSNGVRRRSRARSGAARRPRPAARRRAAMTGSLPPDELEGLKERGWRGCVAINATLERGEIGDDEWHRAMAALIVPAYLAGDDPARAVRPLRRRRSVGGTPAAAARCCGNGRLVSRRRLRERPPAGVCGPLGRRGRCGARPMGRRNLRGSWPISRASELPAWREQIFVGNALDWRPPRRFDFVRTNVDYVPPQRRPELLRRLLADVVEPGGRLIVGVFNEEADHAALERAATSWGLTIAAGRNVPIRTRPRSYDALSGSTPGHGRKGAAPGEVGRVAGAPPSPAAAGPSGPVAALRRPALKAAWLPSRRAALVALATALAGAALYVGARETSVFAIDRIEVHGVAPGTAARVRAALEPLAGSSSSPSTLRTATGASRPFRSVAAASSIAISAYAEGDRRRGGADRAIASGPRCMGRVGQRSRAPQDHRAAAPALPRIWLPANADPLVGAVLADDRRRPSRRSAT